MNQKAKATQSEQKAKQQLSSISDIDRGCCLLQQQVELKFNARERDK